MSDSPFSTRAIEKKQKARKRKRGRNRRRRKRKRQKKKNDENLSVVANHHQGSGAHGSCPQGSSSRGLFSQEPLSQDFLLQCSSSHGGSLQGPLSPGFRSHGNLHKGQVRKDSFRQEYVSGKPSSLSFFAQKGLLQGNLLRDTVREDISHEVTLREDIDRGDIDRGDTVRENTVRRDTDREDTSHEVTLRRDTDRGDMTNPNLLMSPVPSDLSWWTDEIQEWLLDKQPQTQTRYDKILSKLIKFLQASKPQCVRVKKVKLSFLEQWVQSLNVSPGEKRKYVVVCKSFWKSLFNHMRIKINIAKAIRLPPKPVHIRKNKHTTREDIDSFLNWAKRKGATHCGLFGLLYYGGLRIGEACTIRSENILIESERNEETNKTVRSMTLTISGKGSKVREIRIGHNGTKYLRSYLKHLSRSNEDKKGYVFTGRTKLGHKSTRTVYDYVKNAGKDLGMEYFTPHYFRHAFATHAYEAGCTLVDISRALGHKDTKTTLEYIHSGHEAGEFI